MSIINNPHDKFFKETLSDIETTKDFMKNYLPKDLLSVIDLEKLIPQKDSYIEKELEESFSDILFKTNINGTEGYIYFLFEHKSYLSNKISLQLLKYMLNIWEQKTNKEKTANLPVIIPLVVYHGGRKWNIANTLGGIIEGIDKIPDTIRKYIPDYEYILYDLSSHSDEEIKGGTKLRIFLEILKAIFKDDFEEFIKTLKRAVITLEKLEEQQKGIDYFETFIRYIMNARKDLDIKDVYDVVKEISLERSDEIMTIAEQLIKEGMEKGIAKGIEQGVEKGLEKTAEAAFKKGADIDFISDITGLSIDKLKAIKEKVDKEKN